MNSPVPAEFFIEASSGVLQLAERVSELARRFRGQALKEANDGLALTTKELGQFAALIAGMQGLSIEQSPTSGTLSAHFTIDGLSAEQQIARLSTWLELLVEAQGNQDWLTVADVLELDLEPLLRAWVRRLDECIPEADRRP